MTLVKKGQTHNKLETFDPFPYLSVRIKLALLTIPISLKHLHTFDIN